jgi:predicted  nucleic acid-binding Zn-ribbon protein
VHPDLKTVIDLQHVDQKIAELTAQIEDLPSQVKLLEGQLKDYLQAHEDRKLHLSASQKERRELEAEVQQIQTKISKHKDQLYEVKTNEQYKAMLKEIEGEEGNIRKIEDKILENMVEAEDIQKMVTQAAASLESEKARVASEVRRMNSLRDADVKERDGLQAQRKELVGALSASVLETYERVRKGRKGIAVAEVRDGFCTACNVRLRPQVYNDIRLNETLLACESCSRIMYCVEPPIAVNEDIEKTAKGSDHGVAGG